MLRMNYSLFITCDIILTYSHKSKYISEDIKFICL